MGKEILDRIDLTKILSKIKFLCIAVLDHEQEIVYANQAFAKVHGYQMNDVEGVNIQHLYQNTSANISQLQLLGQKIADDGFYGCTEIRHVKKSGEEFFMLQSEQVLEDSSDLTLWTGCDVSKYKEIEEKLQSRYNEVRMLNIAEEPLRTTRNMDKIFDVILTKLMRAYGAIAVSIWLVDRKRQKVVCKKALSPGRSKVEGWEIDLGEGFVGISAKEGQSMLISDVAKDSRYFDEVAKETGVTLRSLVSAPIIKKDKILGVIQVLDQEPNMFSQKDVKLIETIAASASVAIENALFYKKIKHLMKELEEYKKELEEYKKTD